MAQRIVTDLEARSVGVPVARVYVRDSLAAFSATDADPVPYLRVDTLRLTVAPEIDTCELSYVYGEILREDSTQLDEFPPLRLNGKFIKVEFDRVEFPNAPATWYGVIEVDELYPSGSSYSRPSSGRQRLIAYGLLRLLETVRVRGAVVLKGTDEQETIRIGRGLAFNVDDADLLLERGNRSTLRVDGVYVFSAEPRAAQTWTAWEAAEHLLKHHAPVEMTTPEEEEAEPEPAYTWQLVGNEESLAWYQIQLPTDRRRVKEILDELIDRRRGVGYYVAYDESAKTINVHVWTAVSADLVLPDEQRLPANPNQRSLDFEQALDIVAASVRNLVTTRYDRIIAEGAFRTSTCTFLFTAVNQMVPDWTIGDEGDYLAAASQADDYPEDEAEQIARNSVYRESDALRHVWRRWKISETWNQRISDPDGDDDVEYWAAPTFDENGELLDVWSILAPDGDPLSIRRLRILPYLALKDRTDYSEDKIAAGISEPLLFSPQYLPPLVFIRTSANADTSEGPVRWEQVEKLNSRKEPEHTRGWACHVTVLDRAPSIEVSVAGGPQHFLAAGDWSSAAATAPDDDPEEALGLNWQDMRATLTLQLDSRVTAEAVLQEVTGRPERVLTLDVPDARLDYVVPYTVVQIKDGQLVKTTSGGFVRDDRSRLEAIAKAAAEWYSRERQTLALRFRQVRKIVDLGWLITDVGRTYNLELENPQEGVTTTAINTPVTAITYDLVQVETSIETSFADLDLAS